MRNAIIGVVLILLLIVHVQGVEYANTFTPIMTNNTLPAGYIASASSEEFEEEAWNAFNRDNITSWSTWKTGITTGWIQLELPSSKVARNYTIWDSVTVPQSTGASRAPFQWNFSGSTNGTTWDVLDSRTNITWNSTIQESKSFEFNNTNPYMMYRLNVMSNNGDPSCLQIDDIYMYETAKPVALFNVSSTFGYAPMLVTFEDTSLGNPSSWKWSARNITGNNTWFQFSTQEDPEYVFDLGDWDISLNVTNAEGSGISEQSTIIHVEVAAIPNFVANDTYGNPPLSVLFTDLSEGNPTSWDWDFGDEEPHSFVQNPVHTYTSVGVYNVSLHIHNAYNNATVTKTSYITIEEGLISRFDSNVTTGNSSLDVLFNDDSIGSPTGWAWFFGDEPYNQSWTQQNASSSWGSLFAHDSVSMPNGSIILYGGDTVHKYTTPLVNGGFETGNLSGWNIEGLDGTLGATAGSAHSGSYGVRSYTSLPGSGYAWVRNYFAQTTVVGPFTSVEFWYKVNSETHGGDARNYLDIWVGTSYYGAYRIIEIQDPPAGEWTHVVLTQEDIDEDYDPVNPNEHIGFVVSTSSYRVGGTDVANMEVFVDDFKVNIPDVPSSDIWNSTDNGQTWKLVSPDSGFGERELSSSTTHKSSTVKFVDQEFDNNVVLNQYITTISWAPNGRYVALTGDSGLVMLRRDGSNFTMIGTPFHHIYEDEQIRSAWSPDSEYLAVMSNYDDSPILFFRRSGDSFSHEIFPDLRPYDYAVSQPEWSPDGSQVIFPTHAEPFLYEMHEGNFYLVADTGDLGDDEHKGYNHCAWSPNGNHLACVVESGSIHIFNRSDTSYTYIDGAGAGYGGNFHYTPDSMYLVTGLRGTPPEDIPHQTTDPVCRVYAINGSTYTELPPPAYNPGPQGGYNMDISRDGKYVVFYPGYDEYTFMFQDGVLIHIPNAIPDSDFNYDGKFSPIDDYILASGYEGLALYLYAPSTVDTITLTGGRSIVNMFNDTWQSRDYGNLWEKNNYLSEWSPRWNHNLVALSNNSLILIGGQDNVSRFNDTWYLPPDGTHWSSYTTGPWTARHAMSTSITPNGIIVLTGGNTSGGLSNETWRSTNSGLSWTLANASSGWTARELHTTVAQPDNSIVLVGGFDGAYRNDSWRSTDYGSTWIQLPDAEWSARADQSMVAMRDGSIVLTGGASSTRNNQTWRLQPVGSTVQDPVHTYTGVPGQTWNVNLQVFNDEEYNLLPYGQQPNYISIFIQGVMPIVRWVIDKTIIRIPGTVTVNDTSLNTPTEWQYYWGDGTPNSTFQNGTHKFTKRGNFLVTLNATNTGGSNISEPVMVRVIGYDTQGFTPTTSTWEIINYIISVIEDYISWVMMGFP